MAKLFDNKAEKSNIIKGIFLFVGIAAFVFSALWHYRESESSDEYVTDVYIGVHVKGAVESPGFYEVPMGTRVNEMEQYVGGFDENADLDGVNLAGYVSDGQELYIPYKGVAALGALNLNTVTFEELLEVEGIGETYAGKIIGYRKEHGEFKKVIELKALLGTTVYEKVRESFYVE